MSLPSSMADFVPCKRLLQKGLVIVRHEVQLLINRSNRSFERTRL